MEYLNNDIAAPESIRALQCFPAWTMMVGQSVMRVIVTASLLGSPPHVCEGSSSLYHPLNHCPGHQSYNILRVNHQL